MTRPSSATVRSSRTGVRPPPHRVDDVAAGLDRSRSDSAREKLRRCVCSLDAWVRSSCEDERARRRDERWRIGLGLHARRDPRLRCQRRRSRRKSSALRSTRTFSSTSPRRSRARSASRSPGTRAPAASFSRTTERRIDTPLRSPPRPTRTAPSVGCERPSSSTPRAPRTTSARRPVATCSFSARTTSRFTASKPLRFADRYGTSIATAAANVIVRSARRRASVSKKRRSRGTRALCAIVALTAIRTG